jgi:hypothetical protein
MELVEIIWKICTKSVNVSLGRIAEVTGTGTGTVTIEYDTGEEETITDYA